MPLKISYCRVVTKQITCSTHELYYSMTEQHFRYAGNKAIMIIMIEIMFYSPCQSIYKHEQSYTYSVSIEIQCL